MDKMLRQIIDINPHFIFVKDRRGRFTLVNKAVADAYGTTVEELIGRTDADFNPNVAEVEWFRHDDLEVMDTQREKFVPEEVITDASGRRRYLQTTKKPLIDRDGVARHVLGVSIDITALREAEEERRRLQEQMLHAQKLESLGVMAGGIAHDFNNLLVGILSNAELALHRVPADSPAFVAVEPIRVAALRAAELCRHMLAYSGGEPLELEPVDLGAVVRELSTLLAATLSKKASLEIEVPEPLPPIRADASQIRQALMNLITNASDALGNDPGKIAVTIDPRRCEADELPENYVGDELPSGHYVFVEVSDTGSGMDKDTLSRIFDPFFSTKAAGQGLGLASVLGIVRSHRGGLRVESTPGEGTTFQLWFPVAGSDVQRRPKREAPHPTPVEGARILVVDDETMVVSVIQQLLELHGVTVVSAGSAKEALAIFREQRDRLTGVLLDLTMPEKDGYEVLAELRDIRPDVPVVLMSGFEERDTGRPDAAPVTFLRKPFEESDLLRAVAVLRGPVPVSRGTGPE